MLKISEYLNLTIFDSKTQRINPFNFYVYNGSFFIWNDV